MGMERYKGLWRHQIEQLRPELFERDRFFDFDDQLTNIRPDSDPRWEAYYAKQEARFDEAEYVGDKMTMAKMVSIWKAMPEARFVCIVRSAEHVAASWDARAQRASDVNWPARRDSQHAIATWNLHNTRIRRARRRRPDHVAIVEYGSFYGDPEGGSLRRVLDWLGLEMTPEVEAAFASAHDIYTAQVQGKDRSLTPEAQAFVDAETAPNLWKQLTRLAI